MLVVLAGIFLSSCIDSNTPGNFEKNFFDLEEYFKRQSDELSQMDVRIEKLMINNKDTQRVFLDNVSWGEEFAPFTHNDINKPAWKDSYSKDTIFDNGKIKSINYKSSDKNLAVKQIQIYFQNNKVEHIFIENSKKNYVYNSAQVLSYSPASGYIIEGEQDIILGKDLHYKIIVNFIQ